MRQGRDAAGGASAAGSERRDRGRRVFTEVMTHGPPGGPASAVTDGLIDLVFADIWSRPGLSRRDRRFVTLPCVAAADDEASLVDHVHAALNSDDIGITEMREAVLHFAVYGGWPNASRLNAVVNEQWARIHRERGLAVPAPEPLLPLTTVSEPELRLGDGEQAFREINCLPDAPPRDNPYSGAGIPNFVFGEMWLRPGLDRRERRLITLACVAIQGAPVPIDAHVYGALQSGDVSCDEMDELALHFAAYCGWPKASRLSQATSEQKRRITRESGAPAAAQDNAVTRSQATA